jgi:tetratricopeptide (TPR) repeat protein
MTRAVLSALVAAGLIAYVGLMSRDWAAERHYLRGEDERLAGRLPQAVAEYEAAREMLPMCADYQRAAGQASLDQYTAAASAGERDLRSLYRAQDAQQKARDADPRYPYHDFELGLVLFTMRKAGLDGQPSPEPAFARALALDPGNPRFLAGWVRWESSQGHADAAWSSFVKLALLHPKVIPEFAPEMLHGDTDYERFGRDLGDAVEANLNFAAYLLKVQRPDLAEERIAHVPPEAWSEENVAWGVSNILIARDRNEDAQRVLYQAVAKAPSNLNLWYLLGRVLVNDRKFPDAVKAYQRALSVHPGYLPFMLDLARAAESAGQPEVALQSYRAALNHGDLNLAQKKAIFLRIGEILGTRGDVAGALGAYRQARELDPDNHEIGLKIEVLEYKATRSAPAAPRSP